MDQWFFWIGFATAASVGLAAWTIMRHKSPLPQARAILLPSSQLSWLTLTRDQARILNQVVYENRETITKRWSSGIFDGLSGSLSDIDRAGGAYTRIG